MKINWFSPIPPDNTGITTVTKDLVRPLSSLADLTLWTNHKNYDPALLKYANIQYYKADQQGWEISNFWILNQGDATVYNYGNNIAFHSEIWRVSQKYPGIIILHDVKLFDFIFALCWHSSKDRKYFSQLINMYYEGSQGEEVTDKIFKCEISTDELVDKYPFIEFALRDAQAVIVHSKSSFEMLKSICAVPVYFLNLPYQEKTVKKPSRIKKNKRCYHLILFGHSLRNRRVLPVVKALANLPEKNKFKLDIIGLVENKQKLRAEISALGANKIVSLHDFLPEDTLNEKLILADMAFNLRYPTMGEASHSQLKLWEYSIPSLVTKVGYYQALPSNTVVHVSVETEVNDIMCILSDFLKQPEKYKAIGDKGRAYLIKNHSPTQYAKLIIDIIKDKPNLQYLQRTMVKRLAHNCGNFYLKGLEKRAIKLVMELLK